MTFAASQCSPLILEAFAIGARRTIEHEQNRSRMLRLPPSDRVVDVVLQEEPDEEEDEEEDEGDGKEDDDDDGNDDDGYSE